MRTLPVCSRNGLVAWGVKRSRSELMGSPASADQFAVPLIFVQSGRPLPTKRLRMPCAQSESACAYTFIPSCFHARISHVTLSTSLKYLHAFFNLLQLPRVGFAIFVHISFAAYCMSDLSRLMSFSVAAKLLNVVFSVPSSLEQMHSIIFVHVCSIEFSGGRSLPSEPSRLCVAVTS